METTTKYKIAMIGAGNTATVLSKEFMKAGHSISSVWSRVRAHAEKLATDSQSIVLSSLKDLHADNDLIILAVHDAVISEMAAALPIKQQLIVHTAGSVSREVLAPYSDRYGVFYPLQSLRKEIPIHTSIPILIDANTEQSLQLLRTLAETISKQVVQTNDEQRLHAHLSAVLVSNFSNHLYQLAAEWCRKYDIDFNMLIPMIQEVALRQNGGDPSLLQTGPAARGDRETVERHLQLLKDDPFLEKLYQLMSADLLARNTKKEELRTNNSDA